MNAALQLVLWPAFAVLAFFVPAIFGGSGVVYSACVVIAIFAVMSYGLDVIVGDLGEVSLAHPVFFAIGAYVTAMTSSQLGVGPLVSLAATIAFALLVAAGIALVTLHLREFVFSLVTYAVTVVAMTVAANWSFIGGSDGISGIPVFSLFGYTAGTDAELWPIAWAMLLVAIWLVAAFRRSRLGHAAMTVHLNPALATMSGISPARVRMQVFLFSAPITAAAGWLYAYQRAYVSADVLSIYFLILMLTAVVLVGRRMLLAPLAGVAIIILQERFFSWGAYVDRIILGGVLVIVLSFLPRGLAGLVIDASRLLDRGGAARVGTTPEHEKG
ncbi:branched-chain amino acid ABC transporter permease [Acuticoccus sp. I52.16.1]|uniref:branched-chain amino acid ABC transporter permease n=1 Tax=Acuticoccus sp. I52.16.1 TaxID=2928472 RepID=UPI001FD4BD4F|nr:branched-chain amino acid ABC transporter permease [Acuticoccus sp. I52.16.1]UOM32642.1 branched-chain amino acid ABC transporter permease [Acuticoccus sp. I52.16.1]